MPTAKPRPHALYRFYDAAGALLYVGITLNPAARWRQHRDDKPWWTQIAQITIETHPDRPTVLQAERATIEREHPRHNVIHNRPHAAATPPWGNHADDMPDCCHHGCVPNGDYSYYFPHTWTRGRAEYECIRGHQWTCGWGHHHSGSAPDNAGRPAEVLP